MKKHILLGVGLAALYLAAKEYGINSVDDLKRVLKPYLNALDMDEISAVLRGESSSISSSPSSPAASQPGRMTDVPHES